LVIAVVVKPTRVVKRGGLLGVLVELRGRSALLIQVVDVSFVPEVSFHLRPGQTARRLGRLQRRRTVELVGRVLGEEHS
jgi:hypothetical protein